MLNALLTVENSQAIREAKKANVLFTVENSQGVREAKETNVLFIVTDILVGQRWENKRDGRIVAVESVMENTVCVLRERTYGYSRSYLLNNFRLID